MHAHVRMLDPRQVDIVRQWLQGAPKGAAWLTGAAGSGMTTMVRSLVRDMEAVWMTPATLRARSFLKDVCASPVAVTGKRKALVLDELDVVLGVETTMMEVAHILRSSKGVPVICILKSTRAALSCPLRKKASLVVDFAPPREEDVLAAVYAMGRAENLDCSRAEELCAKTRGDVRHVLHTLRASSDATRDVSLCTSDGVAHLLGRTHSTEEAFRLGSQDPWGLSNGVFEVYWQTSKNVEECVAFLDMCSVKDVVDECMHGRQRWDLLDVLCTLACGSAAVLLPRCEHITLDKFGTLWNKHNMMCTRTKQLRNVQSKLLGRTGTNALGVEDLAFVRDMIVRCLPDAKKVADMCAHVGLDATACLDVMRLWNTGYKLSTHIRVRRELA